jgi:serine/threonine-protein kinase RsbW
VADAIAAHAPARSRNGHVTVRLSAGEDGLELQVLELEAGGADGLVADAALPGVGNVLERIADDVRAEDDALVVRLSFV